MTRPTEGWGHPTTARKWHYFRGGRALCGRWMFMGVLEADSTSPGPDDCAACSRARNAERIARPGEAKA